MANSWRASLAGSGQRLTTSGPRRTSPSTLGLYHFWAVQTLGHQERVGFQLQVLSCAETGQTHRSAPTVPLPNYPKVNTAWARNERCNCLGPYSFLLILSRSKDARSPLPLILSLSKDAIFPYQRPTYPVPPNTPGTPRSCQTGPSSSGTPPPNRCGGAVPLAAPRWG